MGFLGLAAISLAGEAGRFLPLFDTVNHFRPVLMAAALALLPGLFLARVDGKSPVEYVTQEQDKDRVRRVARALLADPADVLNDVARAWAEELDA